MASQEAEGINLPLPMILINRQLRFSSIAVHWKRSTTILIDRQRSTGTGENSEEEKSERFVV